MTQGGLSLVRQEAVKLLPSLPGNTGRKFVLIILVHAAERPGETVRERARKGGGGGRERWREVESGKIGREIHRRKGRERQIERKGEVERERDRSREKYGGRGVERRKRER